MPTSTHSDRECYAEYRRLAESDLLPRALRNAILIFFLLQTFVFIPADRVLFPDNFRLFLASRIALDILLALIYFGTSRRWPMTSSAVVCGAGAIVFLTMIAHTGGAGSGYYVGLILVAVGMGVIGPLTGKQGLALSSLLFVGYAALPLFAREPIVWPLFGQHLFFLGAACIEAAWACAYTDRMRFAEFKHQRDLARARDELAELDRAKSRFSANVHHELRTPLTLILAPLDALRGGDFGQLPGRVEQVLDTMHANGRRLHKMINNLLDLSKIESEQLRIRRAPLQLAPVVEELLAGARPLAERKGVQLVADLLETLPEINADRDALEKVLVNLLGNALKFTDSGGRIRVSASRAPERSAQGGVDGEGVHIRVEDTGIGIPPEKLDSVFDRFAQIDASATRRYEGTGIGLALAKEMVELHAGRIWAESEGRDRGTVMQVWLPIGEPDAMLEEDVLRSEGGALLGARHAIENIEADLQLGTSSAEEDRLVDVERSLERWEDARGVSKARAAGSPELERAPEVLIAEDNPDMRALLAMLIGREMRVRSTRNGREALDAVRQRAPDLVLSDVMMPEMSGIELCRTLKADEATRAIPLVLVTSKAESEMKIEGLEFGADDYVTKPFHPRELMARVRALVRVRVLQRELAERNSALEEAIEELKRAQVQLVQAERLAAVGELAAGIAHEVNNPVNFALNAVRAMDAVVKDLCALAGEVARTQARGAEASGDPPGPASARAGDESPAELAETLGELAQIVSEGLTRTHSLVGDLRDFAAPGRSGGARGRVDLARGLRSTVQLLQHKLSARGAQIELEIEADLPPLQGDAGGLNQVFLNLIKNAAESFGEAGGSIHVKLARVEKGWVEIRVCDDGPGVAEDVLPHLFEPFFTTKEAGRGTGLGLSISRRIVEEHAGSLDCERAPQGGAQFVVRLPLSPEPLQSSPEPST